MSKKTGIIVLAALCAVVVLMIGVYFGTRPKVTAGQKDFSVEVVYEDGGKKTFTYTSDEAYVGTVLLREGLIEGEMGDYGLYIQKVDGVQAIYETDNAYWAFYVGGEYAANGIDLTPIENGAVYSLVYTVG